MCQVRAEASGKHKQQGFGRVFILYKAESHCSWLRSRYNLLIFDSNIVCHAITMVETSMRP